MPIGDEAINVFMNLPGEDPSLELTYNHGVTDYDLGTGYNHIALAVDDLDGTLEQLAGDGIEPEKPPYRPGGRTDGPPDRLRPRPGRVPDRAGRDGPTATTSDSPSEAVRRQPPRARMRRRPRYVAGTGRFRADRLVMPSSPIEPTRAFKLAFAVALTLLADRQSAARAPLRRARDLLTALLVVVFLPRWRLTRTTLKLVVAGEASTAAPLTARTLNLYLPGLRAYLRLRALLPLAGFLTQRALEGRAGSRREEAEGDRGLLALGRHPLLRALGDRRLGGGRLDLAGSASARGRFGRFEAADPGDSRRRFFARDFHRHPDRVVRPRRDLAGEEFGREAFDRGVFRRPASGAGHCQPPTSRSSRRWSEPTGDAERVARHLQDRRRAAGGVTRPRPSGRRLFGEGDLAGGAAGDALRRAVVSPSQRNFLRLCRRS